LKKELEVAAERRRAGAEKWIRLEAAEARAAVL
jgi:hypothetical protein